MPVRIFLGFLLLCLLAPAAGRAQTPETGSEIGTILSVEGTATVTTPGRPPAAAALNGKIHLNDVVATGPKSRLFISFMDGTQLTLSENTKLTVDSYVFDPDNGANNKAHYNILEGAFQYISGLIAKKPNPDVGIETPAGAIGVRGTDIIGGEVNGSYGVYVNEGRINFATNAGQVQVGAGLGTSARSRADKPTAAQKWGEDQIRLIRANVTLKDRALIQQRIAALQQQRAQLIAQKRASVKAQVQALFQQKHEAVKAQLAQALQQYRAQAKQALEAAVQQLWQQKRAQVQALVQQGRQQRQAMQQAADPAARQAAREQLQATIQQARQMRETLKADVKTALQPVIAQQRETISQGMQQLQSRLHAQLRQEMEQAIAQMRADARNDIRAQMQQAIAQSKQDLQAQIQQLDADADRQVEQVMQEEEQRDQQSPQ